MPIYSRLSLRTPKQCNVDVMGGGECPWVRVGNVFVSVTFTGDTSWDFLVKALYKAGAGRFRILSGRHGDQLGQEVSPLGMFVPQPPVHGGTRGSVDPEGDRKTARSVQGFHPGSRIEVDDVGDGHGNNTVDLLRHTIETLLINDWIVILSWCYSLYAMKPGWVRTANPFLQKKHALATAFADLVPISTTAHDWDWVLGRFDESIPARSVKEIL